MVAVKGALGLAWRLVGMRQVVMVADPFVIADVARRSPDVLDKGGHIFEAVPKVKLCASLRLTGTCIMMQIELC